MPFDPQLDHLFAFGIDPVDGGLPTDQPSDWPGIEQVRTYVNRVRNEIDAELESFDREVAIDLLRARGSAIGGQNNGSASLIESVAQFYLPGTSPVLVGARGAGADHFRVGFSYAPGIDFSVRASANIGLPLSNWPALATNLFDANGQFSFTNAINPALRQQFYRIQQLP